MSGPKKSGSKAARAKESNVVPFPAPGEAVRAASPTVDDAAARRRIRESLDESLIVEASAGTGKTTELVHRIVAILESGRGEMQNIAAVTFTNKAAGELKLRLREALDHRRHQAGSHHAALSRALQHLEEATIGTIHSFCAQILRERPVEAKVDPSFAELSEAESSRLYATAFRTWLERRLNESSPGLERAFARLAWPEGWDSTPPLDQLRFAGKSLVDWRDYDAPWAGVDFDREPELRALLEQARNVAEQSERARRVNDPLFRSTAPARFAVESINRAGIGDGAGEESTAAWDTVEALLLKLGRELKDDMRKGSGDYGGGVVREDLVEARDQLMAGIEQFRRRADASLAAQLHQEMQSLLAEYEEVKRRQGKLDFQDLLIRTRDLIRDQRPVRQYLQNRLTHLFIDEFQDTDPLQAEILILLAARDPSENDWMKVTPVPGKLFLVGDPKQSIYKFRRADIGLYRQVTQHLTERGAGRVQLTQSFRAVPNIQAFVNAAFAPEMARPGTIDGHQAEWAPLEKYRDDHDGRPSVIALPVPRPYGRRNLSKGAIKDSTPAAIAAFIDWLVNESGWGIAPGDIAVLFRRRKDWKLDWTREIAKGLESRNIPHLMAGSRSFHHREEVATVRAALTAIEWPDDELSVYATLKGPLFAIPDEVLFLHKHRFGKLHPFRSKPGNGAEDASESKAPEMDPAIFEALQLLAALHRDRNRKPLASTVNTLLEATRAHAGFLLRPGGNQILANVARLADLARNYEMSGGISFRGFVEELIAQADKEETSEAPVLEEDSSGVRLMTVHAAKGLEFPVVILADLTTNLTKPEPDQYVDAERHLFATRLLRCAPQDLLDHEAEEQQREHAEGVRVAYVAATRARDLLVIPAVGDEPFPQGGWLSPMDKALYPAREDWRSAKPAPGCPEFGDRSIADRPQGYDSGYMEVPEEWSVRPGLVETGRQKGMPPVEVIWWDPHQLPAGGEPDYGLKSKTLLSKDGGVSSAAYLKWAERRQQTVQQGSAPRLKVFTASEAASTEERREPPRPISVTVAEALPPSGTTTVAGKRYGTLVHRLLAEVPLEAGEAQVRRLAALNGRILGATNPETEASIAAVLGVLRHPLLARARQAERCHREYPVQLMLAPDAVDATPQVLEGVIDLAFLESVAGQEGAQQWVVVDFKTDAEFRQPVSDEQPSKESSNESGRGRLAEYRNQLAWYGYALEELTGISATAYLLAV